MNSAFPPTEPEPAEGSGAKLPLWRAITLLPNSIWLPILAISVLALGAFFVNEWSVGRVGKQAAEVTRLMEAQKKLVQLRERLLDAETAQLGFLLLRKEAYLQSYEDALDQLPALGGEIRMILAHEPELLDRLRGLEALRSRKMAELGATIALVQRGEPLDAIAMVRTGEGTALMDEFQASSAEALRGIETRVLETREAQTRNRQVSRFASGIMGLLTLLLLLLVIRLFLAEAARQEERRGIEAEARRRLESIVDDRTHELSELSTYLQDALERERATLARDLHDELGGLLTAARMDLSWLEGRSRSLDEEFRGKLAELNQGLTQAMDLKRRVVENLRPALLDHFGLPTALQAYFDETCRKAGINCRATIPEEFEHVPPEVAIALFRVGQESLTNILRHAKATNVEMTLENTDTGYRILISDDGAGMDLARVRASHGLTGMRHRIESLGGRLHVDSAPGRGTRVTIDVPRDRTTRAGARVHLEQT
jgi:signal transduction histidine kinase